jgi:hypothetical protein
MKKRKIRKLIVRSMAIPQWSDSIPHPSEPRAEKKIIIKTRNHAKSEPISRGRNIFLL